MLVILWYMCRQVSSRFGKVKFSYKLVVSEYLYLHELLRLLMQIFHLVMSKQLLSIRCILSCMKIY